MSPSPWGNLGAQASGHFPPRPLCVSIPVRPHESGPHGAKGSLGLGSATDLLGDLGQDTSPLRL